jgi:alkane 1-monooxygenase
MDAKATLSARYAVKAAGFASMLCIPALGPLGLLAGWPWLSPTVIFVAVPLLDLVVGEDRTNEDGRAPDRWTAYHYLIPHAYAFVWLACTVWTAQLLKGVGVASSGGAGLLLAAGLASAFATCAAHELLHRPGAWDQWAARTIMAICCYGHFVVEHLHHHANAGHVEAGTVPKPGESMFAFIVRNACFSFGNAYTVAEAMRRRRGLGWTGNRVVRQHALTAVTFALCVAAFGATGAILFAAQALIAIATVEMVQYFEHYGLLRREGEPLGAEHAWNSNGWVTNAITLNITRHSDHHLHARVPYQALRLHRGAPTMPFGYFGLTWLALLPPVWRAAIDKRVPKTLRDSYSHLPSH